MSIDLSEYKVGVILSLEECGKCKSGKGLRACRVRIGGQESDFDEEEDCLTVVTSATNVREKSRVAVAPAGSSFLDGEGSMQEVTKATVGGIVSEGMFCDSRMLGWSGGAQGVAAQIPDSCEIGSAPPATKPRPGGAGGDNVSSAESSVAGLFEKKLTKEEKKKLAEERRKARKAAKEAKTNAAK